MTTATEWWNIIGRNGGIAYIESAMRGASETMDKMLAEIHTRAGCERDGLAGILGWIDDAKDAVLERDDLRAKLEAQRHNIPEYVLSELRDLRAKLAEAQSELDELPSRAGIDRILVERDMAVARLAELQQPPPAAPQPAIRAEACGSGGGGCFPGEANPQPAATPPAADHGIRIAELEAQVAEARWLLQTADECLHHDHPSKLIAQWLKETGPKGDA